MTPLVERMRSLAIGASLPVVVMLLTMAPAPAGSSPICFWRLGTGHACPGCGMTRAMAAALRGDVGAALAFHPLVLPAAVQLAVGWVWFILQRAGVLRPPSIRAINAILALNLVLFVSVWVVRAATGTLPPV